MFTIKKNLQKRTGKIITKNGKINIPFFMPDATRGFVKSLSKNDLEKINIQSMVVNTYHLYLQPGIKTIKKFGGINKFMNWNYPLLSDSGGYQIFSLIHKNPKRGQITDKKVVFNSSLDGSWHEFTPEKSIKIQFDLGVDMMVCLDDPPPNIYSKEKIKQAVERTLIWAKKCKDEYVRQIKKRKINEKDRPLIFGVIQGGEHLDLRKYCVEELVNIGFDGYGFGARHVDKNGKFLEDILRHTADWIPENSLRFALGVGTPEDIARCVAMGWDMFDCVIPTREGRHGRLFVWNEQADFLISSILKRSVCQKEKKSRCFEKKEHFYKTININNKKYKEDFSPVDPNCSCELCKNYTRAHLRHLFVLKDPLAMRLASLHNLKFYFDLMKKIRAC